MATKGKRARRTESAAERAGQKIARALRRANQTSDQSSRRAGRAQVIATYLAPIFAALFVAGLGLPGSVPQRLPSPSSPAAAATAVDEPTPSPAEPTEQPPSAPEPTLQKPLTVAITEVMANPCGDWVQNEYVELYNWGDAPVDTAGWYMAVTRPEGGYVPDELTTWGRNHRDVSLAGDPLRDSSILYPGQYGVVLSPGYHERARGKPMPYEFSSDNVILSIGRHPKTDSARLGNDGAGLLGMEHQTLSAILLYEGSPTHVNTRISSYGGVAPGGDPLHLSRLYEDFPLPVGRCYSVGRFYPAAEGDSVGLWGKEEGGSPGWAGVPQALGLE